jgi:hypothetical protein
MGRHVTTVVMVCVFGIVVSPYILAQDRTEPSITAKQCIGEWEVVSEMSLNDFSIPTDYSRIELTKNQFRQLEQKKLNGLPGVAKSDDQDPERNDYLDIKWEQQNGGPIKLVFLDRETETGPPTDKVLYQGLMQVHEDRAILKMIYADVDLVDLKIPKSNEYRMITRILSLRRITK